MLLDGLRVVLVNTRFPENVGMAVRACANMGCSELSLVTPERWIPEKAAPLATPKGLALLKSVELLPSLEEAVKDCHLIVGTTARTGGWRRGILSPAECSQEVRSYLERQEKVAIVFGSEDRGLENIHIEHCQRLVTIPTSGEASSLNLAQAVLILLYECSLAVRHLRVTAPAGGEGASIAGEDMERLMDFLKDALLRLDVLHGNNPDYFLMTWRRFFARAGLKRHEYDAFMGLCRQVRAKLGVEKQISRTKP